MPVNVPEKLRVVLSAAVAGGIAAVRAAAVVTLAPAIISDLRSSPVWWSLPFASTSSTELGLRHDPGAAARVLPAVHVRDLREVER